MRPRPEPLDPVEAALRVEVGRFRAAERRRCFPLGLHLGRPAGPRETVTAPWPEVLDYDASLRTDLAEALLGRTHADRVQVWVTRPGVPDLHDADLGWLAAVRRACLAYEVELAAFHVVTRTGWLDPVTGRRKAWVRLRLGESPPEASPTDQSPTDQSPTD